MTAAILPIAIASYSIVGEKVEKSFEPLLAAPTTDSELLLGKSIAAFLPPLIATYIGSLIFMVLMNIVSFSVLTYLYFPNWMIGIILRLTAPLSAILSTEISVIISVRASDVRSAQTLAALIILPFGVIYVASELGILSLIANTLLIISIAIFLIDVVLFSISARNCHGAPAVADREASSHYSEYQ